MKKIRKEKFSGSPDVNASVVSINIFLIIFGAFLQYQPGGFINRYRDLMSVYNTIEKFKVFLIYVKNIKIQF